MNEGWGTRRIAKALGKGPILVSKIIAEIKAEARRETPEVLARAGMDVYYAKMIQDGCGDGANFKIEITVNT